MVTKEGVLRMRTISRKSSFGLPARLLALTLVFILAFGVLAPGAYAVVLTPGDFLRYIPVGIAVTDSAVQVYGYFTNLNSNCTVSNFRDFSLDVYMDDYLIASGYFGTIDYFEIEPEGVLYHTFVFPGRSGLVPGAYVCEDDDCCVLSCTFDYTELVNRENGVK